MGVTNNGGTTEPQNWDAYQDSRFVNIVSRLDGLMHQVNAAAPVDLRNSVEKVVGRVLSYVLDEEVQMQVAGFPGTGQHQIVHHEMCVATSKLKYRINDMALFLAELKKVRGLWLHHFREADRQFEVYLVYLE